MLSDGETEMLAGDVEPFLIDDLSEAMVDSDDDDDDDGVGSSVVPGDLRWWSTCPFCRGTSTTAGLSTTGELEMVVSWSRAPLSTSSHPSKSLPGAVVDGGG